MRPKRLIIWSIIGTGISSVITQLLTIREFLSQFHGNEITISLVLFCWFLITGLGSLGAKALRRPSLPVFALLTLIIAFWPLIQMVLIRGFRDELFIHGASPGFYAIFFYVIITITPYCLLTGFILPYALFVLNDYDPTFTTGALYLTDNIGDITGGLLFSFVFVYFLKPFPTIAVTSALLVGVGLLLLMTSRRYAFLFAALPAATLFFYYATDAGFEKSTLKSQYGNILRYVESPYGRIVVSEQEEQKTFWESGAPLYSDADTIHAEEKVHYPLSQIERVSRVLLVSGGLGESLEEVAKYDPAHVDYVELDPFLTKTALELDVIKDAPFIDIVNTDGRMYIKRAEHKYDAIIIDLPDPDTFQLNRFFTTEFFALAKGCLKKGGILSTNMEYSPNYLSRMKREKLSTLYNTVRQHFSHVLVLPGEDAYFLCRDQPLWWDIPARLERKSIETAYISGFFYGNVTEERIQHLAEALEKKGHVNRDLKPRLMNIVFHEWFMKYGSSPTYFIVIFVMLTATYIVFLRREEYLLFSTGLSTMGVEMLIIFSFQIIYGYIYLQIGAIVTSFLLGLLPGAILGHRMKTKDLGKLLMSEAILLFLLLLFFVWIVYLKGEPHPLAFLCYGFFFSLLCGFQFPVAAGTIGEQSSPAAGCLAADLCGAAVGTLAVGTLLIPLLGIRSAVIFLLLVKISSSILVLTKRGIRVVSF